MIKIETDRKEYVARAEYKFGRDNPEHLKVDITFMEYVDIDKDFGPTIPATIRIKLNLENMTWEIYRQSFIRITKQENCDTIEELGWVHWVDIPAQLDEDFYNIEEGDNV